MTTRLQSFWRGLIGQARREPSVVATTPAPRARVPGPTIEIAPDDPIIPYFDRAQGIVELDKLNLDSPALRALRQAGVQMAAPLVSQGELIGLLNLGPRLSEQDYSTDDRRLLNNLAAQAAPALRVAQLVRQQQAEARQRERIEQELLIARTIQQTLLPKELPAIGGWHLDAYYQPARAVGGDFYDFLFFEDGRIGLVIADVTDKGVPAALVMATARSMLRTVALRLISPSEVLERVNEMIEPDIPPNMFITCFYAVLDPDTGHLWYANAGHDLPYRRTAQGVAELRATGMPLGLLPGMSYEEKETTITRGENIILYSDGLVEAHNASREMFGFPRLGELMSRQPEDSSLIQYLLAELASFTGEDWEQEDDVTLVTLERTGSDKVPTIDSSSSQTPGEPSGNGGWQTLAEFTVPSEFGNERLAMKEIAAAVESLNLPTGRLEQLKTAVAEATMNAIEYGNRDTPDIPVYYKVLTSDRALAVQITDQGGGGPIPEPAAPDLEAKLAGLQSPRGWGLFLIRSMVDELHITSADAHNTVELVLYLQGENHGSPTS